MFEKRRRLMGSWAAYCDAVPDRGGNVVAIDAAALSA
jgi:hypothetical protein